MPKGLIYSNFTVVSNQYSQFKCFKFFLHLILSILDVQFSVFMLTYVFSVLMTLHVSFSSIYSTYDNNLGFYLNTALKTFIIAFHLFYVGFLMECECGQRCGCQRTIC